MSSTLPTPAKAAQESLPTTTSGGNKPSPLSAEVLEEAIAKVSEQPLRSLAQLEEIGRAVSLAQLFSANESWADVATSSLKFLQVDHYQAMAHLNVPSSPAQPFARLQHVRQGIALHAAFVQRLMDLEDVFGSDRVTGGAEGSTESAAVVVVPEKVIREWLERQEEQQQQQDQDQDNHRRRMPSSLSRQDKIARFRQKQDLKRQLDHMQALQQRRARLSLRQEDLMEGHDEESLERHVWKQRLAHLALESMEEVESSQQEMVMLQMALDRQGQATPQEPPPPPPTRPLTLMHVTQDATTGQLAFAKQEMQSQVFRPHWNQPTMTLAQLGEQERAAALAREQSAASSSLEGGGGPPKRMEQLVREGLEEDSDLVDQATEADRQWDEFREANPRGSGNKRADLGDRNF